MRGDKSCDFVLISGIPCLLHVFCVAWCRIRRAEKKIIHESFRLRVFTGAEIKPCPTHFNVFRPHGVAPNVPCRHVVTETTVLIWSLCWRRLTPTSRSSLPVGHFLWCVLWCFSCVTRRLCSQTVVGHVVWHVWRRYSELQCSVKEQ